MNNTSSIAPNLSEAANALRFLAMDAVEKANSGHPGMPMGMADIATTLWRQFLRHNPGNPHWPNRDRFVLSNGHGSMLLYALLHLSGYDLPMGELQRFRQLHSKTPGHPENTCTIGVETTTGPLGQGLANAVGMALAEKLLAAEFNRPGVELVDHTTWVFLGDGCLMEGISHEACSLAGTWQLGKLICFYDDNGISIDGHVAGWFTDNTPQRFAAYGWQVLANVNGHDEAEVARAIRTAQSNREQPTLICCKTIIGLGAPTKAGSHDAHGAALGAKEVSAAREFLHWPHAPFVIPPPLRQAWDARSAGSRAEGDWQMLLDRYTKAYPAEAAEFTRRIAGDLPTTWPDHVRQFLAQVQTKAETIASRKASQNCLESYGPVLPELLGGSADLTGSNLTNWSRSKAITAQDSGNYLHYGVREFAMTAINTGIALHGGFIPYGGTFLTFSDYSRNGLRMAALMRLRSISVFTHDSIGLGEDGPTHQPIEHLATLRLIPNMDVWRPGDSYETAVAWTAAIERKNGPSSLCLSRQNLPFVPRTPEQAAMVMRGGYVLRDAPSPQVVLLATGSEVAVALQAYEKLRETGISARVVSLPCTNLFDRQDESYRRSVLPLGVPRVSVEAGVTGFWRQYVGLEGATVGIDRFGESAPAGELFKLFGITAERVAAAAQEVICQQQKISPLA